MGMPPPPPGGATGRPIWKVYTGYGGNSAPVLAFYPRRMPCKKNRTIPNNPSNPNPLIRALPRATRRKTWAAVRLATKVKKAVPAANSLRLSQSDRGRAALPGLFLLDFFGIAALAKSSNPFYHA